jgi:hypothetical protein
MPHTLKTSVDHQARGEFLDSFHQLQAAFAAVQSEVQHWHGRHKINLTLNIR